MTITLVAQIAPQRSTQYADFVTQLAPLEIALSPLRTMIAGDVQPVTLGTQSYLKFTLEDGELHAALPVLADLVMTDAYFVFYESIGNETGPFLKPVALEQKRALPETLVMTRRYRGKTNELLTWFMVNLARYSSDYATTDWRKLTILDPLAGGGTTLFVGAVLGADVAGVETDKQVAEGTAGFIKQFMREQKIAVKFNQDRLKGVGKRWFFTLDQTMRCVIGHGDTSDVRHFVHGLKRPQLIVTDLPYGIQHRAAWHELLVAALPAWAAVLADGGALVFSWNATHFPRAEMIDLVQSASDFTVLDDAPYDQLGHRVDRVIKQRDIIVARR